MTNMFEQEKGLSDSFRKLLLALMIISIIGGLATFICAIEWNTGNWDITQKWHTSEEFRTTHGIASIICFALAFLISMLIFKNTLIKIILILLTILSVGLYVGNYLYMERKEIIKEYEENHPFQYLSPEEFFGY